MINRKSSFKVYAPCVLPDGVGRTLFWPASSDPMSQPNVVVFDSPTVNSFWNSLVRERYAALDVPKYTQIGSKGASIDATTAAEQLRIAENQGASAHLAILIAYLADKAGLKLSKIGNPEVIWASGCVAKNSDIVAPNIKAGQMTAKVESYIDHSINKKYRSVFLAAASDRTSLKPETSSKLRHFIFHVNKKIDLDHGPAIIWIPNISDFLNEITRKDYVFKGLSRSRLRVVIVIISILLLTLSSPWIFKQLRAPSVECRSNYAAGLFSISFLSCLYRGYPTFQNDEIGILVRGDEVGGFKEDDLYSMINEELEVSKRPGSNIPVAMIEQANKIRIVALVPKIQSPDYENIMQKSNAFMVLPDKYDPDSLAFKGGRAIININKVFSFPNVKFFLLPQRIDLHVIFDYLPGGVEYPYINLLTQDLQRPDMIKIYTSAFKKNAGLISDRVLAQKETISLSYLSWPLMQDYLSNADPMTIWPTVFLPDAYMPKNQLHLRELNMHVNKLGTLLLSSSCIKTAFTDANENDYHPVASDYLTCASLDTYSSQLMTMLQLETKIDYSYKELSPLIEYSFTKFIVFLYLNYYRGGNDGKSVEFHIAAPDAYDKIEVSIPNSFFREEDRRYLISAVDTMPQKLDAKQFAALMEDTLNNNAQLKIISWRWMFEFINQAHRQLLWDYYNALENKDLSTQNMFIVMNMLSQLYLCQRMTQQYIEITWKCYEFLKIRGEVSVEERLLYLRSTLHSLSISQTGSIDQENVQKERIRRYSEIWDASRYHIEIRNLLIFDLMFEEERTLDELSEALGQEITLKSIIADLNDKNNNIVKFRMATIESNESIAKNILLQLKGNADRGFIRYGEPISKRFDYNDIRLPVSWIDSYIDSIDCNADPPKYFLLPPFYWNTSFIVLGCRRNGDANINIQIKLPNAIK